MTGFLRRFDTSFVRRCLARKIGGGKVCAGGGLQKGKVGMIVGGMAKKEVGANI